MSGWIMLAAAILPAAMLWLYIWKKDSQPEPTSWLVKAVLLGIGICIPVVIVEIGIEMFLYSVGTFRWYSICRMRRIGIRCHRKCFLHFG